MPLAALREILEAADFHPPAAPDIRGADPVVRTRYRVGTAGAAALGALGLAAAQLWQLRGGRAQRVAVDVRAAAASLRSARYLRIDGKPPPAVGPAERLLPGARRLDQHPLQFRQSPRRGARRARHRRGSRRRRAGEPRLGRARARGRDPRRAAAAPGFVAVGVGVGAASARAGGRRRSRCSRSSASAMRRPSRSRRAHVRSPACACSTSRACSRARPARAASPSTAPTC